MNTDNPINRLLLDVLQTGVWQSETGEVFRYAVDIDDTGSAHNLRTEVLR